MTELFTVQGVVVSTYDEPVKYAVAWCEQFNFSFILMSDVHATLLTYLLPGTLIEYDVEILNREGYRKISTKGHDIRVPHIRGGKGSESQFKNMPIARYSERINENVSQRVEWRDEFVLKSTQDEDNLYIAKGKNLIAEIPLSDALKFVSAEIYSFTAVAEVKTESFGDDKYFWRIKEYFYEGKICQLDDLIARISDVFETSPSFVGSRKLRKKDGFQKVEDRTNTIRRRNITTAVMKPIMIKSTDESLRIPETEMAIFLGLVVNFDTVWIVYSIKHSEFIKVSGKIEMKTGKWYKFEVYEKDPCTQVLTREHFIFRAVDEEPPNIHTRFLPCRESSRSGLVVLVTILTPRISEDYGELYFDHPTFEHLMASEDVIEEGHRLRNRKVLAELTCLNTGWEIMKIHEENHLNSLTRLSDPFFNYEFKFYDEYIEQGWIMEELQQRNQEQKAIKDIERQQRSGFDVTERRETPPVEKKQSPTIANDLFSFITKLHLEADKKHGVLEKLSDTFRTENGDVPENILTSKTNYMNFLQEKYDKVSIIDERLKLFNVMEPDVLKNSDGELSRKNDISSDTDSFSHSSFPSSSKFVSSFNQLEDHPVNADDNILKSEKSEHSWFASEHDMPCTSNSISESFETMQDASDEQEITPTRNYVRSRLAAGKETADENLPKSPQTVNSSFSGGLLETTTLQPEAIHEKQHSPVNSFKKPSKSSSSFFPKSSRSKRVMKSLRVDNTISTPASPLKPDEITLEEKYDSNFAQTAHDLKLASDSEEELQSLHVDSPMTPPPYIPLIGEEIMDQIEFEKEQPLGSVDEQRFAVGLVVKEYASSVLLYSPDVNFNKILVKRSLLRNSPFERSGFLPKLGVWMKIAMVQPRRPRGRDIENAPVFSHIAISPPEPFDIQSVSGGILWKQRFFNGIFETYQTVVLNVEVELPTSIVDQRMYFRVQSLLTIWVLIPMERLELLVLGGCPKMNCKLSFWVTRLRCEEHNALFLCDNQPIRIENADGTLDELSPKFGLGTAQRNESAVQFCFNSLPALKPTFAEKPDVKMITADDSSCPEDAENDRESCSNKTESKRQSKSNSMTPNATSTPVASDEEAIEDSLSTDQFAILEDCGLPDGDLRELFLEKLSILYHPRVQEVLENEELLNLMPFLEDWRAESEENLEF